MFGIIKLVDRYERCCVALSVVYMVINYGLIITSDGCSMFNIRGDIFFSGIPRMGEMVDG